MSNELNEVEEFKSSPKLMEMLNEHGIIRHYKEGEAIVGENTQIMAIPLVKRGAIRVLRTDEDGREILLYYIKPGESCIMSFLGGMHNDTSKIHAEAEEPTEILFVPMDKVIFFIKEFPQWLDYIFRLYHQRFEELLDVINAMAFKKVDERLMMLLQKKANVTGSKNLYITHEQLANELGTARVVVSRLLKQLEASGTVKLGRNKLSLLV
jgi:CRP/FNR family transcriptional regulator